MSNLWRRAPAAVAPSGRPVASVLSSTRTTPASSTHWRSGPLLWLPGAGCRWGPAQGSYFDSKALSTGIFNFYEPRLEYSHALSHYMTQIHSMIPALCSRVRCSRDHTKSCKELQRPIQTIVFDQHVEMLGKHLLDAFKKHAVQVSLISDRCSPNTACVAPCPARPPLCQLRHSRCPAPQRGGPKTAAVLSQAMMDLERQLSLPPGAHQS